MQRKDSSGGLSCNGKQARKLPDSGSSGRVGLCHLALKCIANQNSALYKSKESIDWWVTDTSDGNCWNTFFCFLKARNCSFEQQKKMQTDKKTEQNWTLCSCHSFTHFIFVIPISEGFFFFTWAFTPIGLGSIYYGVNSGQGLTFTQTDFQRNT